MHAGSNLSAQRLAVGHIVKGSPSRARMTVRDQLIAKQEFLSCLLARMDPLSDEYKMASRKRLSSEIGRLQTLDAQRKQKDKPGRRDG